MSRKTGIFPLAVAALALAPAVSCVALLTDRNSPLPSGGVTGIAADCSVVTPVPTGGVGSGPAQPLLVGRYEITDGNARFDWSGNYIRARFEGSRVSVGLHVQAAAPPGPGEPPREAKPIVFVAVLDDREPVKFLVRQGDASKLVADGLGPGPHEITIHRNTEAQNGQTTFTGFDFGPGGKLLPPTERPRRIEIIGDSITCGYGNEGPNATCPFAIQEPARIPDAAPVDYPATENQYLAYGSIAARALSADAVTLCYSGKGVYQNYREARPDLKEPFDEDAKTTLRAYFNRTLAGNKELLWDFSKEPEPQVVLINLGTNDFSRDFDRDTIADGLDLGEFRRTYLAFVEDVRRRRPSAHIFLAVPPMLTDKFPDDDDRSECREILRGIADQFNAKGDTKVYMMEFVEMGSRYGLGCDYHPNLEVHRIMADQMIGAIRSKTCW